MRAGGRRRNLGDGGQFGRGAGMAVHQAAQHARARRLGDRAGQAREMGIGGGSIHISIVDEACRHEKSRLRGMMNSIAPPTDAIAAVTHGNPYPWYAAPAQRAGAGLRPAAEALDRQPRRGAARDASPTMRCACARRPRRCRRAIAGTPAGELFGLLVRMNDGALHTAHKPLLQRALAGLDLAAAHAATLRIAAAMPAMTLADRAFALPVGAVAQLLGFADRELPQVAQWTRDFVACLSPLSSARPAGVGEAAAARLMDRFEAAGRRPPGPRRQPARGRAGRGAGAAVAGAARQPGGPAVADLRGHGRAAGQRPGRAGAGTGPAPQDRRSAGHCCPCWWRKSRATIPRSTTRAASSPRRPRSPASRLAPGDAVLLVLAAANRDPALNPAPATFELMRPDRRAWASATAAHACPGQALACHPGGRRPPGAAGRAGSTPMRCCGAAGTTARRSTRGFPVFH